MAASRAERKWLLLHSRTRFLRSASIRVPCCVTLLAVLSLAVVSQHVLCAFSAAPMLSFRSPALQKALLAEIPRLGLSVSATPPSAGARQRPASQDGAVSEAAPEPLGGAQDFFLFIKDYGWSLRYRVSKIAESVLNEEQPLELDWIKLRRPLRDPAELLDANKDQLFDWDTVAPAQHQGFMYHVTSAIGSGVEAVINFFEGHGLKLLIRPDTGIQLLGRGPRDAKTADDDQKPLEVTHCWVQVWGMPFLPMLQSIAFYNWHQVVLDYQA